MKKILLFSILNLRVPKSSFSVLLLSDELFDFGSLIFRRWEEMHSRRERIEGRQRIENMQPGKCEAASRGKYQ